MSEEDRRPFLIKLSNYEKLANQAPLKIKDKNAIDDTIEQFQTKFAKIKSLIDL